MTRCEKDKEASSNDDMKLLAFDLVADRLFPSRHYFKRRCTAKVHQELETEIWRLVTEYVAQKIFLAPAEMGGDREGLSSVLLLPLRLSSLIHYPHVIIKDCTKIATE